MGEMLTPNSKIIHERGWSVINNCSFCSTVTGFSLQVCFVCVVLSVDFCVSLSNRQGRIHINKYPINTDLASPSFSEAACYKLFWLNSGHPNYADKIGVAFCSRMINHSGEISVHLNKVMYRIEFYFLGEEEFINTSGLKARRIGLWDAK